MAKILCLETSTEVCSVSLIDQNTSLGILEVEEYKHSSMLVPLIKRLMDESKITFAELDAIAVSKGPGSYTGLRVGVSTAKGLAFALDLPLLGINTLHGLAYYSINEYKERYIDYVVPMIDARRNEVYTAILDNKNNIIESTQALVLDDTYRNRLEKDKSYLFCGNGMHKVIPFLKDKSLVHFLDSKCSARGMIELARKHFRDKIFEKLDTFSPLYLKPPNITTPKKTFPV